MTFWTSSCSLSVVQRSRPVLAQASVLARPAAATMPPKATPSLDRGAAGAQEHLGADLVPALRWVVPALPWVGFFDVPESELVAETGQEGTLAGGQARRWQTVGRAV
jgi:hypothetical protein